NNFRQISTGMEIEPEIALEVLKGMTPQEKLWHLVEISKRSSFQKALSEKEEEIQQKAREIEDLKSQLHNLKHRMGELVHEKEQLLNNLRMAEIEATEARNEVLKERQTIGEVEVKYGRKI